MWERRKRIKERNKFHFPISLFLLLIQDSKITWHWLPIIWLFGVFVHNQRSQKVAITYLLLLLLLYPTHHCPFPFSHYPTIYIYIYIYPTIPIPRVTCNIPRFSGGGLWVIPNNNFLLHSLFVLFLCTIWCFMLCLCLWVFIFTIIFTVYCLLLLLLLWNCCCCCCCCHCCLYQYLYLLPLHLLLLLSVVGTIYWLNCNLLRVTTVPVPHTALTLETKTYFY